MYELENTPLESPAVGGPDPMSERIVDERGPAEGEDHGREESRPLGCCSENDGWDEGGEHGLVDGEDLWL